MQQDTGYYVIRKQAVPEVLLKVVEAKKLLESGKVKTASEAAQQLGISRSSFYKYKEDIYEFHDSLQGTTLTLTFQMNDEVGLLSYVLNLIADFGAKCVRTKRKESMLLHILSAYLIKYQPSRWNCTTSAANTMETIDSSLMRMLIEGPEVSLKGSPTVSPTTAALC